MAAKLASLSENNEILISNRYFQRIHRTLDTNLCKCYGNEQIWNKMDFRKKKAFDFNTAYGLRIQWCKDHGADIIGRLIALDKK